jgi:8-oxo-dGTP diphosphatase
MDLRIRRRGTALVVNENNEILLVSGRSKVFMLPGGGANKGETRFQAAIRELQEETGLKAYYAEVLFKFESKDTHKAYGGYYFQDSHTVVLIKATGKPKPRSDAKYAVWYNKDSDIKLTKSTIEILDKYYNQ